MKWLTLQRMLVYYSASISISHLIVAKTTYSTSATQAAAVCVRVVLQVVGGLIGPSGICGKMENLLSRVKYIEVQKITMFNKYQLLPKRNQPAFNQSFMISTWRKYSIIQQLLQTCKLQYIILVCKNIKIGDLACLSVRQVCKVNINVYK